MGRLPTHTDTACSDDIAAAAAPSAMPNAECHAHAMNKTSADSADDQPATVPAAQLRTLRPFTSGKLALTATASKRTSADTRSVACH
jgi:hypothetical protein